MKIEITTPPPWGGKPQVMATWVEGPFRRFALAGRTDIVVCDTVKEGEVESLLVYPERSSSHRALVAALGLNAE